MKKEEGKKHFISVLIIFTTPHALINILDIDRKKEKMVIVAYVTN